MPLARTGKSLSLVLLTSALLACGGGGSGGGAASSSSSSISSTASSAVSSASSSVSSEAASSISSSTSSSEGASSSSAAASSSSSSAVVSSSSSSAASSYSVVLGSTGATGWAAVGTNNLGATGTTGGDGATTIYTVSNRNQLLQALYSSVTINTDGSFSGTLNANKKIIYVSGTISLNMNKALTEYTADAYVAASCAKSTYGYSTESELWSAYYAAYKPSVWGLSTGVSGNPELARACAQALQGKVVKVPVPSNTSIIGLGSDAKIVHGNLVIGSGTSSTSDNVVIRNITFEDSFDFFPQWDPTDSGGRWNSQYDNISVMYATHVWIDHCEFSDGARIDHNYPSVWTDVIGSVNYAASDFKVQHHDGLVDITKSANYVTLSNNYFHDHDKSFNIGGTDTVSTTGERPGVLNVTFHHNYFKNLKQRQARMRYGQIHMYNNYYEGTTSSSADYPWAVAWSTGNGAKAYMENNVFTVTGASVSSLAGGSVSSSKVTACTDAGYSTEGCTAYFYDSGTVLNGSSVSVTSSVTMSNVTKSAYWTPATAYGASYTLDATTNLATTVPANAGVAKASASGAKRK